jgi:SanA protein
MTMRRGLWITAALVAAAVVALIAAQIWVRAAGVPVVGRGELPARPVVIVPGAMVRADGRPSTVLADRLDCALELYRAGARRILVSGDHGGAGYDEVNAMRDYLRARGVPDSDVFMDHAGFRTLDTVERARRVFRVRGAVICTQALHAPRTAFLARRAGLDAVVRTSDRHDYGNAVMRRGRETMAVALAAWDALVGTEPARLGPAVPIDGDARASHDRWTR